ncbi:response regulator transcription factor [Prosthecobacter sp.]|jgi:CheY-like chemotaxis protein|uniref:response regulator transcription factor n=1 Tax=Prosthecobacter sp. TaxID=1965333 RepID=UPI0037CC6751
MSTPTQNATVSPANTTAGKRLLVVDDHPVFRHGICHYLSQFSDVTVCGEASNAQSALVVMRLHKPEVALLDVSIPGTNGIELIKHMLAEQPSLIILMISMHDESLWRGMKLNASGPGLSCDEHSKISPRFALWKSLTKRSTSTCLCRPSITNGPGLRISRCS